MNFLHRHEQSHEQITEERRRVAHTVVPECDNRLIALRIQQTIGISNCEGERSFSTLSRAKNHLRATTSQYRLDHLAVMIIESDLIRALDVTTLIDEFAHDNEKSTTTFLTKAGLL